MAYSFKSGENMILEKEKMIISPKQPYFVMNSSRYYKAIVMNYGVTSIIKNAGQIKIKELADETHYSVRYINKTFLQEFGLAPKMFSKMMRFQNLLSNLNKFEFGIFNVDLTEIAVKLGYYDQPHMIKEFQQFTNTTPNKYIHSLRKTQYNKKIIIV